ncbi:predicted protein [Nematostella vectensis]|uniref:SH2 domain-containing protein n=1 Tax=Nematostella vectensis TaxID=45351 RepID=A7T8K3_NEMVE|nr:predicted protein [Nematostella vectensis]|eukprot:XP_001619782.1 hypothetical protein NEMVEDRAFT_v1g223830 [Nematostella vectensis]
MFKKGKKKKQEKATKENGKIADGSNESKAYTKGAPKNSSDQTDGFDKDGFVDLQPIASNVTILGPRQSCKASRDIADTYVGTFAVISSADGRKSLRTHKERTSYMKEHLKNYRSTTNGVAVLVQVSDDGIKVLSSDGKHMTFIVLLDSLYPGNMRAETPTMVGGGAKVEYLGSPSEEEAVQRLNDHQNEYWYMPGIPRMNIGTCQAFQGMYIVYDYQNVYCYKPGIPRYDIVYDYQNECWYKPGIPRMNISTCQALQGMYIVYDYQNECWYMPGIPREFIMEMLQASEEGSFFVRDSQSKPGCHALTVRVPTEVHASGFGNYLITPIPEGVKLEGFSRTFTDLVSLIEYYSYHADGLPCRLLLGGSNILCNDDENNDYTNSVPLDPDYRLMSDFHSMMEELK